MRRLFSTFAPGAPGAGLLLMRVTAGSTLVVNAVEAFAASTPVVARAFDAVSVVIAALLFMGLWTPVAGALVAIFALGQAFADHQTTSFYFMLGALGIALMLLGPGAWSVDARLFGWKRVEIRNGKSNGNGVRGAK